jgi:hypothetical protein
MSRARRSIAQGVLTLLVWVGGVEVASAQMYGVYADGAWWDGVMYSTATGYDYEDPSYYHWGHETSTVLNSPTRTAYGSTGTYLSFDDEFDYWDTTATYSFTCSQGGYIEVSTPWSLNMTYPSQSGGAPDPAKLQACLTACTQSSLQRANFCRSLPPFPPALRAACWAVHLASVAACQGFCYWYFT